MDIIHIEYLSRVTQIFYPKLYFGHYFKYNNLSEDILTIYTNCYLVTREYFYMANPVFDVMKPTVNEVEN
jgi:hypothetical protein